MCVVECYLDQNVAVNISSFKYCFSGTISTKQQLYITRYTVYIHKQRKNIEKNITI